jgi:3-dehydroquinate synthetase
MGVLGDSGLPERIDDLLRDLGLPSDLRSLRAACGARLSPEEIIAGMRHDKKGSLGNPRLVLPRTAGRIEIDVAVDLRSLAEVLEGA